MARCVAVEKAVRDLIPTLDGWCPVERALEYVDIIREEHVTTSVCIGVWGGRDVLPMAMAHRSIGHGRVIAVDPWSADASVVDQSGANVDFWKNQEMHETVYKRFLEHLRHYNLEDWCDVRRMRSVESAVPGEIGLLIIDGNHGRTAIDDVLRWAPSVRSKGVVFCDDLGWEGGAVQAAVEELRRLGFEHERDADLGAFFRRR